jgi:hypothetical protein
MRVVEGDWLPVADCAHLIGPIPGDSHDADPKQLETIPASFWKLLTTLFLTHEYVPFPPLVSNDVEVWLVVIV